MSRSKYEIHSSSMIQNQTQEAAIDVSVQHLKNETSSYIQVSDPAQGTQNDGLAS
jgi:hypothetical protein